MQDTDTSNTPLPLRNDTLLGVCQAIGEDFGFNPNFLRVLLAAMVIWSPTAAFSIYFALGLLVAASRLLFPNRSKASTALSHAHGREANDDAEAVKIAA